jgi:hypothetical protein
VIARSMLLGLMLLSFVGCGPTGPKVVSIRGQALHQGKPIPNLFLNLIPEKGRPGWALTDKDGKFVAEYSRAQQGMLLGNYKVWVRYQPGSVEEEMAMLEGKTSEQAPEMKAVLEKYGSEEKSLKINITEPTDELKLNFD